MAAKRQADRKGTEERDASRRRKLDAMEARRLLGNVAVADIIATVGQAEGGVAVLSPQQIVERRRDAALRDEIAEEVAAARKETQRRTRALDRLDKKEKRGPLSPEEVEERAKLRAGRAALEKIVDRGVADLQVLGTPGSPLAASNDVRARRDPTRVTFPSSTRDVTPAGLTDKGFGRGETVMTDHLSGGQSRSVTQAESWNITPTSYTKERSTSSKTVTPSDTSEASITRTGGLDASSGDVTASTATTRKTSRTDAATGDKTSISTGTTKKLNLGGYSTSEERTETVKNKQTKSSASTAYGRADGQLSMKSSKTTGSATVDSEGNVLTGTSQTTSKSGGVIAKEGQAGLAGTMGSETTTTHHKGVSTKQAVTLGGKVLITSEQVPGSSPPTYRVGLVINLAGGLTLGGEAAAKATPSTSGGSASVALSLSGDLTGTFTHLMSEEDMMAYRRAVETNTAGAYRELEVVALAARGALQEASALLRKINTALGSGTAARALEEGDRAEITSSETGGISGGLSGSTPSGGRLGVELGYSASGKLRRTVSRENGLIVITVAVDDEGKLTGGLTVGQGAGSFGVKRTDGTQSGRSVTFELNPTMDEAAFDAAYEEITSAQSEAELRQLESRYGQVVTSSTVSAGESTDITDTLSLVAKTEFTESTSLKGALTTDQRGTTLEVTGSGSLGYNMSVPGLPALKGKTTDVFIGRAGPDQRGTGEASTTRSSIDLAKSVSAASKAFTESPIATTVGAITGSGVFWKDRVDTTGTKLSDADYDRLYAYAHDEGAWMKSFSATVNDGGVQAWLATREWILASGGERAQIASALAEFQSGDSGRGQTIRSAIHRSGGGLRYEFPDELLAHKAAYEELVVADPGAKIDQLAVAGNYHQAATQLKTDLDRLTKLADTLRSNQGLFASTGTFAEMLRRVTSRAQQLRERIQWLLTAARAGSPATSQSPVMNKVGESSFVAAPGPSVAPANVRQEQEMLRRAAAQERLNDLTRDCEAMRQREQAAFAAIDAMYNRWWGRTNRLSSMEKYSAFQRLYGLQELYKEWDQAVADIRRIVAEEHGNPAIADQFAPDRSRYAQVHRSLQW